MEVTDIGVIDLTSCSQDLNGSVTLMRLGGFLLLQPSQSRMRCAILVNDIFMNFSYIEAVANPPSIDEFDVYHVPTAVTLLREERR